MRKIVRNLCLALIILLAAMVGGFKFAYDDVSKDSVPEVSLQVFGTTISSNGYTWRSPVLGGLLYKEFSQEKENKPVVLDDQKSRQIKDSDEMTEESPAFQIPEGFSAEISLQREGEEIFSGTPDQWQDELFARDGQYLLSIECQREKQDRKGYGEVAFAVAFYVTPPDPVFETGKTDLFQGEVFSMSISHVPEGVKPVAKTALGMSVFMPLEDGQWVGFAPVGNTRTPGKYLVDVSAGDFTWQALVTVIAYEFETQNLIINTSDPVISQANSSEAYQQYREKIPPLFETYDEQIYWEGTFIEPCSGRISTQFGMTRYTNSNWSNPRYHWGMDIAAAKGTPVKAPNNGRVVLAEYLLNTGNTVAIEHGGGLKSYYFHMDTLGVSAGDMVQKGDIIGTVGNTGYSTGAHLHFEMRLGNQAINPSMLFENTASMYGVF